MIQYIKLNEQRFTFLDFLELTEGISPKETKYDFQKDVDSFYSGFDTSDGKILCVMQKTQRPGWYEVGFGRHIANRPFTPDPNNYTMTEQLPAQNFFDVFGRVLFVVLDMCNKHITDVNRLRFSGGYKAIADFYQVLMHNTRFMAKLKSFGFEMDAESMKRYGSGVFVLKRVDAK